MARSQSDRLPRLAFAYRGLRVLTAMAAMVIARTTRTVRGKHLFVLTVVGAVVVVAAVITARWGFSSQDDKDIVWHTVERGEFIHDITVKGNVESASNIEIVCKVKPKNYSGTAIAWIVPEGTVIEPEDCLPEGVEITYDIIRKLKELEEAEASTPHEENADVGGETETETAALSPRDAPPRITEPGLTAVSSAEPEVDSQSSASELPQITIEELREKMILVKFDTVGLENDRIQQEIIYQNSSAAVVAAQNALDTARIAKDEYLQGTHQEAVLAKNIQIKEANVDILQAKQDLRFSEKLYRKGYATKDQLENDRTKLMKAQNQLELLQKELEVLEKYTKKKKVKELEADIISAEAKLKAEQASNKLDKEKLDDIETQITNCTIFATEPGTVVYANKEGYHGHGEVVIQEGTEIRFNQEIIRLPDPTQMQIEARITEGKISLVKSGQEATIQLDAFPDLELKGVVEKVNEYPAGTGWLSSAVREYETLVKILDPPPDLRPGMNSEIKIRVNRLDSVLHVPVQAIVEHRKKLYCIVPGSEGPEKREVIIGASNEKHVVITEGLEEGDKVVQNAMKYREQVGLGEEKGKAEEETKTDEGPSESDSPEPGQGRGGPQGQQEGSGPAASGRPDPATIIAKVFQENDKNKNGKLEEDEVPAPMQAGFDDADTDGDGAISRQELSAAFRMRMSAGGRGGRPPGDNP